MAGKDLWSLCEAYDMLPIAGHLMFLHLSGVPAGPRVKLRCSPRYLSVTG